MSVKNTAIALALAAFVAAPAFAAETTTTIKTDETPAAASANASVKAPMKKHHAAKHAKHVSMKKETMKK